MPTDRMRRFPTLSDITYIALAWLLTVTGAIAAGAKAPGAVPEPEFDLRVLIDQSGSMRQTDPLLLRTPALKLLAELLSPEGQAGVWGFAQSTDLLVPMGKPSKAWKAKATQAANRIHSRGLFTNIEDALKEATTDWTDSPTERQRQLLLLTDGMVDVAKDPAMNAASQTRILQELLPKLQSLNVKIHTIALSAGADRHLLEQLAVATGGSFESADSADALQRVFLHMFEKAAPRDTLPLTDNRFRVDSSVEELTMLVFRRHPNAPTVVVLPDGSSLEPTSKREGLRWHREGQYDLVTLEKPVPGDWKLQADMDPDNRVMVVTNLKLKLNDVPNNVVLGERFDLEASLLGGTEAVTRQDFLKLVKLQGQVTVAQPDPEHAPATNAPSGHAPESAQESQGDQHTSSPSSPATTHTSSAHGDAAASPVPDAASAKEDHAEISSATKHHDDSGASIDHGNARNAEGAEPPEAAADGAAGAHPDKQKGRTPDATVAEHAEEGSSKAASAKEHPADKALTAGPGVEGIEFSLSADNGLYQAALGPQLHDGRNEVRVIAKSPTFERERHLTLSVYATPVIIKAMPVEHTGQLAFDVEFSAIPGLLDLNQTRLTVHIANANGRSHAVEAKKAEGQGWKLRLQGLEKGSATIKGELQGKTVHGQNVHFETEPVHIGPETKAVPAATETKPEETATAETATIHPESNLLRSSSIVLGANLLLALACYATFTWLRRRAASAPALDHGL